MATAEAIQNPTQMREGVQIQREQTPDPTAFAGTAPPTNRLQNQPNDWGEFQMYLAFRKMKSKEFESRCLDRSLLYVSNMQETARERDFNPRPRTPEHPRWQAGHPDLNGRNTELSPLVPPQATTSYPAGEPNGRGEPRTDNSVERPHTETPDLTPQAREGGSSQGPLPTSNVTIEPRFEDRSRSHPLADSGNTRQIEKTPSRIFQPIKVATYRGTKKEEGFPAQRFIKRMETYLRNTPGLTNGQMGLTFFHNLANGAQDWLQSADDAYIDLTGESLLENWEALKEKFLHRYGQTDPAQSAVKLGQ